MRWRYSTQVALINGGGIRSQLPACSYQPTNNALRRANYDVNDHTTIVTCAGYAAGPPYDIVLGDIFTVLPFGNIMNTRTVTGAQLWAGAGERRPGDHLGRDGSDGRFPQISGFRFSFRY